MLAALALLGALAGAGVAGCGGGDGRAELRLTWSFADGRTCADAGVTLVVVAVGGEDVGAFSCREGELPPGVRIEAVPAGEVLLQLGARTAQGATIYRADRPLALRAGQVARTTAVLQYTGGG